MDKKFGIQLVVLMIVIFGGLLSIFNPALFGLPSVIPGGGTPGGNIGGQEPLSMQQIFFIDSQSTGNPELVKAILVAEVAKEPSERAKGLSNRQSMAENAGMIFLFPQAEKYNFIMKQMGFSLDFIWVNGDTVVDILENISPDPAGTPDNALKRYAPVAAVDKVIEVNAGYIAKNGIKVGDRIRMENVVESATAAPDGYQTF